MVLSVLIVTGRCPYLSQTGEQYVDSQSPDGCSLHQIVFTVGQPQQHGDAHQLGLILKDNITRHTDTSMKLKNKQENKGKLTGSCAKACGRMEESVSQALVCSVGCCSFCSAPFSGPLKTSDQNSTTYIMPTYV